MVKKIIYTALACTLFILLNIFSRFLYAQSWFSTSSFTKTLDPFTIITLIVSSAVTIWLGWYVSKKITEQRFEKEYFISDLKQIENEINLIEKYIRCSNLDVQLLIEKLNMLGTYIDRFSKTIEIFKSNSINAVGLNANYNKLYNKTTDVDGDQLVIEETNRNEINQVCSESITEIRRLIYIINKN